MNTTITGSADIDGGVTHLDLLIQANATDYDTFFLAQSLVTVIAGDSGVIAGTSEGLAVAFVGTQTYPCVDFTQSITGTVYTNFGSSGLNAFTLPLSGAMRCDQTAQGINAIATGTLPSLTFGGLSFGGVSVRIVSGRTFWHPVNNPFMLTATPFTNVSLVTSAMVGGITAALTLGLNHTASNTSFSATAAFAYSTPVMTNGLFSVSASLGIMGVGTSQAKYVGAAHIGLTGLDSGLPDIVVDCVLQSNLDFSVWSVNTTLHGSLGFDMGNGERFSLNSPILSIMYNKALAQYMNITLSIGVGTGTLSVGTSLPYIASLGGSGITVMAAFPSVNILDFGKSIMSLLPPAVDPFSYMHADPLLSQVESALTPMFTNLKVAFKLSSKPKITATGNVQLFGVNATGAVVVYKSGSNWQTAISFSIVHSASSFPSLNVNPAWLSTGMNIFLAEFGNALDTLAFYRLSAPLTDPAIITALNPRVTVGSIGAGFSVVIVPSGLVSAFAGIINALPSAVRSTVLTAGGILPPMTMSLNTPRNMRLSLSVAATFTMGSATVTGFDIFCQVSLIGAPPSIAFGIGLDYLSIGSGNDELQVYADFLYVEPPPSFNFDIVFTRVNPWVNPFGLSKLLRIEFPLELEFGATITPDGPVPTLFGFSGAISGLPDARYPATTMTLSTTLVADLQDLSKTALVLNATNLAMGRLLYTMGGYRLSPGADPLYDILDATSCQSLFVSANAGPDQVCTKGGACIDPGFELDVTELSLWGFVHISRAVWKVEPFPPSFEALLIAEPIHFGPLSVTSADGSAGPSVYAAASLLPTPSVTLLITGSFQLLSIFSLTIYITTLPTGFLANASLTLDAWQFGVSILLVAPSLTSIWSTPVDQILPSLMANQLTVTFSASFDLGAYIGATFVSVAKPIIETLIALVNGALQRVQDAQSALSAAQSSFNSAQSSLNSAQSLAASAMAQAQQQVNTLQASADIAYSDYQGWGFIASQPPCLPTWCVSCALAR